MKLNEVSNAITNTIVKISNAIKKNGIMVITWAFIIFAMSYSIIINPININEVINGIHTKDKMEHDENVNKRLLADQFIPNILETIRLKYNLDRVSLLEMHNSTNNINGVSFLFFSMVYEDVNDSLDYISDNYQYQRTGNFSDLFSEMKKKGCVVINNMKHDTKYKRITKRMVKNGTQSAIFIPIYNQNGRIDAMLVLSSCKTTIDYPTISKTLPKYTNEIKKYII